MLRIAALALPLLAAPLARAAAVDIPLAGDLVNGAKLYRLHCAACHGVGGGGEGPLAAGLDPKPGAVRDGALLWSKPTDSLVSTIGGANQPKGMNAHGRGLSMLDTRDIVAWMRSTVPAIRDLFPAASHYIAHVQAIDSFGLERAEKVLGTALPESDRATMIYTVFKPADPPEGEKAQPNVGPARLASEAPAELYELKPRRKLGFVGFVPFQVEGGSFQIGFAFDRRMSLWEVRTISSGDEKVEAARQKLDKMLRSYVGSGGREEKRPVESHDKSLKVPKDVHATMLRAYTRVLEAATMYEKEERDRFWADPDAFKFPEAADQPEDVKFEFKTKKTK